MKVTPTSNSRLSDIDFNNLQFGRVFSDHMLEMTYKDGEWSEPEIKPYGPITVEPSLHALHYGQAIFEGMKAYYAEPGTINLFRLNDHHERLNNSAHRLCMPEVEREYFHQGTGRADQA